MTKVNYIIQLNSVLERFNNDHRIKQGHICLYMAFFQKWNREFFKKKISINREMIMEKAKFKSKTTYHNYIKDLNDWGYLKYYPSYNPARGSEVEMFVFYTQASQKLANIVPEPGQYLVPFIKQKNKNIKKQTRPKNEQVVTDYFKKRGWPEIEGKKFYAYLQSKNWSNENGLNNKNWQGLAYNFYKNNFQKVETYSSSPISGYLKKFRE